MSVKYRSLKGCESELGKEHTLLNSKRKKTSNPMKNGQRASKSLYTGGYTNGQWMFLKKKKASNPYDSLGRRKLKLQ